MGVKKIKATKKNSAKTEEVITMTQRGMALADEHPYWVLSALVGLLLVLVLVYGGYRYQVNKAQQAQAAYAKIMQQWPQHKQTMDPKAWQGIATELQQYIKQHGGTTPGLHAQMDLAQAYFWMHRYGDAAKQDLQVLNKLGSGSAMEPLVRYHLALTYQEMGKTKEALAQWQILENQTAPGLRREMNWHLANLYMQQKDYAKAVNHYERAMQASGGYPSQPLIQQELAAAKVKTGAAVAPKASKPKPAAKS